MTAPREPPPRLALFTDALQLSLATALALGIARFSYALLLPPMKASLGWNYAQAGALNTANALGYLLGALAYPLLARRFEPRHLVLAGSLAVTLAMAMAGVLTDYDALLVQRLSCGLCSALIFVGGGVLAARLAALHPQRAGWVLGMYYGGTGWGIALSAVLVPWTLGATRFGWQHAWIALAIGGALFAAAVWPAMQKVSVAAEPVTALAPTPSPHLGRMSLLLGAYALFGIGYIGYMTFIIALLGAAGLGSRALTAFYAMLGLATALSGRLWAALLQRARGGGAFALLSLLLAAATLLPALSGAPVAAFASGLLFGATFLAVVSSTTAFVRHNLPRPRWSTGISLFTIAFALGQIVGPVAMGYISDGAGLARGFACSAGVLFGAALLAAAQRPLAA
jgi:predicted MFS family arabinose efflux permease